MEFEFEATVQADFQTAEATLNFDGDDYSVSYSAATHDADDALADALDKLVSRDWHEFYLASDSTFVAEISEQDFTNAMEDAEATDGVVVAWQSIGSMVYHGEPGVGPHSAVRWVALDVALNSLTTRQYSRVIMIQDGGDWKLWTMDGPSHAVPVSSLSPNGWGFLQETATATGSFGSGPGTAPSGSGSAQISLGSTGGGLYGTLPFAGTRLDSISAINYSTYQPSGNPGTVQTISLQFDMDYDLTDATTSWQGRLVYEPYFTETVSKGSWQTWDPLQGKWWATGSPGNGTCPQSNPCTWSQVLAAFPNPGLRATVGGLEFKAGSGWPANWQGNVDAFVIVVGDEAQAFDFEP
ncbi:MAG: hypothetical protein AB7J35_15515 [Dehalococcoidia bacterium]